MTKLTVGKLDNIIVQPVSRNELSSFISWVHGDLSAQDLSIILSEYEQRRRLVACPSPLEVLAGDQRIAGAYLSCLPGRLAMLGAVRALSTYESLGSLAIEKLIQQLRGSMPNCQIQAAIGDHDHPAAQMITAAGLRLLTTVQQWWVNPKQVIVPDGDNLGSRAMDSVSHHSSGEITNQSKNLSQNPLHRFEVDGRESLSQNPLLRFEVDGRESLSQNPLLRFGGEGRVRGASSFRIDSKHRVSGASQLTFRPAYELSRRSFLRLFQDTLEGTLDCPELNELRSPDQTLDSFFLGRKLRQCHLWQAVWLNRQPAGCLILAQHDHGVAELVYMGLAAWARGMGLGNQLVQHAKQLSAGLGASMLALAVDHRNSPAQKIYQQAGFQKHRSLQVYWF